MKGFFGEHDRMLDIKGRVILPARFRDRFEGTAFLTRSLDGCLALYTDEEFEQVTDELRQKSKRGVDERNVVRTLAAGTVEVEPDRQGRVAIPAHLRTYAGLDERVMIVGAISRVEIWDADKWSRQVAQGEDALAGPGQNLADIGI